MVELTGSRRVTSVLWLADLVAGVLSFSVEEELRLASILCPAVEFCTGLSVTEELARLSVPTRLFSVA